MALTFDYKVRDRSGRLVEGQLDGDSMALVVRRLREMGYMPISVTPKSQVNLKTEIKIPGFSDRVKLREVAVVTRQLSTMVDSGLSVVRSLGILAAQVENPSWRGSSTRCGSTSSTVRRCRPRAPSTRRSSPSCSARWSRRARSAVTSTRCSTAWPTPSRSRPQLNRTIRSAMTYPAVVLVVMVLIFSAMIIFIVPVFQNLFTDLGRKAAAPHADR